MEVILGLMIPIIALLIPLAAVVLHSPAGKVWARRLEQQLPPDQALELAELRQRVQALETQLGEQDGQLQQLQASSEFTLKLLDSRDAAVGQAPRLTARPAPDGQGS